MRRESSETKVHRTRCTSGILPPETAGKREIMQKKDRTESAKNDSTVEGNQQHFMFEGLHFDRVIAHGGSSFISTRRVLEARMGTSVNFIDLAIVPSSSDIGVHTHTEDNEEIYIIISGQGEMMVDGETLRVSPGHVVVNRPGGTHSLKNTGDTDLRLVVIEVSASLPT